MCGIAGFLWRQEMQPGALDRQLSVLAHRGPDSQGGFARGCGAIGQTRLAIIDLVTGDPPITNEDGTVGVALNGEIYNYRELREELVGDGHTLATSGDTEVLAHLAESLAPVEVARRLHGMFAFAIWDSRRERLVLGRDRLGKKPLYYWTGPKGVVFGSEIKAVLAHPAVPADLDGEAVPAYLRFGYVPTPRTFFAGVQSIPPGHVLYVEGTAPPRLEQYWHPPVAGVAGVPRKSLSLPEAGREVRARLTTAVRRRLISDVPLGAFLSGGIDSSGVVALMAEASSRPVRTFTIGFEDTDGFDERPFARLVAERFGTDHNEFVVSPKAVDLVERLVWHHDQPFGDSSAVPTYLLSELTRGQVTVALSGDGGDELFAGYERFAAGLAAGALDHLPGAARRAVARLLGTVPADVAGGRGAKVRRFAAVSDLGLPDAFRAWVNYVPDHVARRLSPNGTGWAVEDYRSIWESSTGAHTLDRLLLLNLRTYLLDDLLPKVDRMAMAHGLEVRSPFLDHELVEFALRLPPSVKLRGVALKRCLKAALADLLPREVLHRPKHGFGVPLRRWFRDDLSSYLDATLASPAARVRAHLAGEVIDDVVEEHRRGHADHGHVLWTLLTLEVFLRRQGW